jgi:archaellum biogenesis protein FlaJ (TadC family)
MQNQHFKDSLVVASYRLFGNLVPNMPKVKGDYEKSGIKIAFESYGALAIFGCTLTAVLTFAVSLWLESVFVASLGKCLLGALVLSLVGAVFCMFCFILYPVKQTKHNQKEIDSNLIYTVGYMSVLSVGGISVERIFERVVEVESNKVIKSLFSRFTTNIKLFGADLNASLIDVQARSASDVLSKLLLSINSTMKTSGDIKNVLAFETHNLLALKREQLKKRLAGMVALSELYITAMVLAPITFIIMITLLSTLSGSSMGISPATQLNLIVFFGLPALCVLFIVILDGALPKED